MSEDRRRILNLLAEGKITVSEAEELLAAVESRGMEPGAPDQDEAAALPARSKPRYLRVVVEPSEDNPKGDRVNIRVPLGLLRAGVKLASVIPRGAADKVASALKDKDINLDLHGLKPEQFDELVDGLAELSVDVDSGTEKVRVFCE